MTLCHLRVRLRPLVPRFFLCRRLPAGAGVLLTFDDGPDGGATPAVLDRLRAYGARAVFFVTGRRTERWPGLVRRLVAEGHRVGNHTYSHPRPGTLGAAGYLRDVWRCQRAIAHAGVAPPRLFRPPYGRLSAVTLLGPRALGLRPVTWSLDVNDWECADAGDSRRAADALLERVAPRDIVLLHDNHGSVLAVLDRILPALARRFDLASGVDLLGGPPSGRIAVPHVEQF
jgi:peptidoglycan/xylan/chitin deacetylase (PgdA/CDA1 family)